MINKISSLIVEKRKLVLIIMLVITLISVGLMTQVEINEDMTKYLPDDSRMKMGLDIMSEEFPSVPEDKYIRVMFNGLSDEEKQDCLLKLQEIENVSSVTYDPKSQDYNKDNYTLYTLNIDCDYGSEQESAIESALEANFPENTPVWRSGDMSLPGLPMYIAVMAVTILLIILFIMCSSWIEPILFLFAIGIAIAVNMGTNIVLGSVSNITFSIAAILQLVLSMDYSIILINRYRQEKVNESDPAEAMKKALANAFSSIASSSLTTVVGLLALLFMSFKIGFDLGIVLAKGVAISMICILTVMPGIILMFDKLIEKTSKKELHIPMNWAAKTGYRLRALVCLLFVVLFVGSYILQGATEIAYTLTDEDPVAEVFPSENMLVMIYDNKDEAKIAEIAAELEKDENIKSVMSYSTMLAKEYTSAQLPKAIESMAGELPLDESIVKMLYYNYHTGGKIESMTAGELLKFISQNADNPLFAQYLSDENMKSNMNMLSSFTDAKTLTTPMSAEELAKLFNMKSDDIKNLYLYYFIRNGGVSVGKMTLPVFADFVVNEVAKDKTYGSMFDKETLSLLSQLQLFTDADKMTKPCTYKEIASMLGIEQDLAKMLMGYYLASDESYNPGKITVPEFTSLITKLSSDEMFSSYFDEETSSQLDMLCKFTDKNEAQKQRSSRELASMLGVEKSMTDMIFMLYHKGMTIGKTMSLEQTVDYILSSRAIKGMMNETDVAQLTMLQTLMKGSINGTSFSCDELAGLLGMDESMLRILFAINESDEKNPKASMQEIMNFLNKNKDLVSSMGDSSMTGMVSTGSSIINGSVSGKAYTPKELASLTGMTGDQSQQLYLLYTSNHKDTSGWKLSIRDFINFINTHILPNEDFSDQFDSNTASLLKVAQKLVSAVVSGKSYSPEEMLNLFEGFSDMLNRNTVELMYLYCAGLKNSDPKWTLSMEKLFNHLVNDILPDERFSSMIDDEMKKTLTDAETQMADGKSQLIAKNHSRMIISSLYVDGTEESTAFLSALHEKCGKELTGDYYLIGNSAMSYEMQQTFDKELLFITILTAVAIFVIIAITFRSIAIPLILVLIVQCGVFVTICVLGLRGLSIYYLALLIVECILMGSTIDYGILFTNYYRESRKTMDVRDSLIAAYNGSSHTIFTSGLIMILVTAIVGNFFENPTVGQICKTVSVGCTSAAVLILFVLPGLLAAFDKFTAKMKK